MTSKQTGGLRVIGIHNNIISLVGNLNAGGKVGEGDEALRKDWSGLNPELPLALRLSKELICLTPTPTGLV